MFLYIFQTKEWVHNGADRLCLCVCVHSGSKRTKKKYDRSTLDKRTHLGKSAQMCKSSSFGSAWIIDDEGGGDRNGIVHDRDRLCFNIINNNNNKKKSHSNWTPFLQETPLAPGRGHFIILILYNFETCAPWAFTHSIPLTIVPSSFDCLIIDESPTIDVCVCVCVDMPVMLHRKRVGSDTFSSCR